MTDEDTLVTGSIFLEKAGGGGLANYEVRFWVI